jgi:hypothetical protein
MALDDVRHVSDLLTGARAIKRIQALADSLEAAIEKFSS